MYDAPALVGPIQFPVTVGLKLTVQKERALRRWLSAYKRPEGYMLERDIFGGRGCYRLSLRTPQEAVDVVEVWELELHG